MLFFFSCIDDYRNHTSCITEAERYEKTVFKGVRKGEQGTNKKKLSPQEVWLNLIQTASASSPAEIRQHMEELSSLDNVPRKEKAFRNFASNSLRLRGNQGNNIIDIIWTHLCKVRQESQEEKNCDKKSNDHPLKENEIEQDSDEKSKETIALPQNETESIPNDALPLIAATKTSGKSNNKNKDLLKVIKKKLKKSPKHKMKIKALRKDLKTNNAFLLKKDEFKAMVKKLVKEKSEKFTMKGKYISLV